MSNYLLAIAIGPVQDFIAAARRTSDFWYGSKLLSEISKAVARELKKEEDIELIFPPKDNLNNDNVDIANQIVALVGNVDANEIQALAEKAKEAARDYWRGEAEEALRLIHKEGGDGLINSEIWPHQLNDVLELYAAWVPLEGDEKYADQHRRLMTLLSARKNTRNFRPGQGFTGVRKSLLDGAKESVLLDEELSIKQVKAYRKLGIKVAGAHRCEPLDLSGVVKRVCSSKKRYPSVARIAVNSWIKKQAGLKTVATQDKPSKSIFEELRDDAEKIPPHLVARIDKSYSDYQNFPFDGTLFYPDRYSSILIEGGEEENKALEDFRQKLLKLLKDVIDEKPSPYLAIISADGDRMGEVLKSHATLKEHQAISRQLAVFSSQVRQCVEKEHLGACIYAGGDDVLALVPLDQALLCAKALHSAFNNALRDYPSPQGSATLSVGIAVGHFMESLNDLLALAKEAEHCAKGDERNGLSILFQPRGGDRYIWRESWSTSPDRRLQDWIDAFNDKTLPNALPYELKQLLDVYKHFQESSVREPLVKDALRLLKAKAVDHARLLDCINDCSNQKVMQQLIEELLLASRLATALSGRE